MREETLIYAKILAYFQSGLYETATISSVMAAVKYYCANDPSFFEIVREGMRSCLRAHETRFEWKEDPNPQIAEEAQSQNESDKDDDSICVPADRDDDFKRMDSGPMVIEDDDDCYMTVK